jgi:hypothetical protein
VFRGDVGSPGSTSQVTFTPSKPLFVNQSQRQLLNTWAAQGDKEALNIIKNKVGSFSEVGDSYISKKAVELGYDSVVYHNIDRPQVGTEIRDVVNNQSYAVNKATAEAYSYGRTPKRTAEVAVPEYKSKSPFEVKDSTEALARLKKSLQPKETLVTEKSVQPVFKKTELKALSSDEKDITIDNGSITGDRKEKRITASEFVNRLARSNPDFAANPVVVSEGDKLVFRSGNSVTKINKEVFGITDPMPDGVTITFKPNKKTLGGKVEAEVDMVKFAEEMEKKYRECN